MILDIKKQIATIDGKNYNYTDIESVDSCKSNQISPELVDIFKFLKKWFNNSPIIKVTTSGSTGKPKQISLDKEKIMNSAKMTCEYFKLKKGDNILLCMNLKHIGAIMVVVRALILGMNIVVKKASGNPLESVKEKIKIASMVPLQIYNSINNVDQKKKLEEIDIIIIGGGSINKTLEKHLQNMTNNIYSTYGMTETISHIAIRKINKPNNSNYYKPLNGVELSISPKNTLIINAPLIIKKPIITNDVAKINKDGSLSIIGRYDNIINSGGIKIQIEELEKVIFSKINNRYAITSIIDEKLGEALVLLIEGNNNLENIKSKISNIKNKYHIPKRILNVEKIPLTKNGKINRLECKILANKICNV